MLKGIKAILFDYDGVLADTADDNYRAWSRALGTHGAGITREQLFLNEGRKVSEIVRMMLGPERGTDEKLVKEIALSKDRLYAEQNSLRLYPGVEELLGTLRTKGLLLAMVTGAAASRLKHPLVEKLRGSLDAVVCGDDCKIGKPSAEPYLLAAQKLNVPASECLVVENSPVGIQAARAAGMRCAAVCSTLEKKFLADADYVLEKITDVA